MFVISLSACVFRGDIDLSVKRPPVQFDLSHVKDGVYRGVHDLNDFIYAVDVVIQSNHIEEILIVKVPERVLARKCGLCEAMAMIREVKEDQQVDVDAYSGATRTTRALSKAVENALLSVKPLGEGMMGP